MFETDELGSLRYDWEMGMAEKLYHMPFMDLLYLAQTIHRRYFPGNLVQRSTLLSVKTGGCPEDCKYCPQSAHYKTGVRRHDVLAKEEVLEQARVAKLQGSTRFCMGAAWREVRDGSDFDAILQLVQAVSEEGLEVCCTLGMLSREQAQRLKAAGCYAYNHNLDTSPDYYSKIVSTRSYDERLETLANVRAAGMTVCCGGIVGLGESESDRIALLVQLATCRPHPESVPINMLVRVEGTPLAGALPVSPLEFVRLVALARIMMPASFVRLSAGRLELSDEAHALAFFAGANSIFAGEKLLTTPNPNADVDARLLGRLGLAYYVPNDLPVKFLEQGLA